MRTTTKSVFGLATLGLALSSSHAAAAGETAQVSAVASRPGATVRVHGSLATGSTIDLAFAARSDNACFPVVRNNHFDGKHVFFRTSLPAGSIMKIRAIPSRPDVDVSLYAYSTGVGSPQVPPDVSGVVSCEASHGGRVSLNKPFNPGETEQVQLNAVKNPYDVVIGVAGAQGLKQGDFDLEIELSGGGPPAPTGKIASSVPLVAVPGKTVSVTGSIDGGVQIPLGFAAQSSVACFVAPANGHYTGKHVVYSFDLPPRTTAKIELVPNDAKTDVSLYAYSVGPSFAQLPPEVSSVVSCEASPAANRAPNPGGAEKVELVAITNPYKVFVGVAGAQNALSGSFTLKVTLSPR